MKNKKTVTKNKKSTKASKKASNGCSSPVCKLMTGAKGRAFGKAGEAFYKEYLKIAKKEGNKAASKELAAAILEMSAMAKGKVCGCTQHDGCECC